MLYPNGRYFTRSPGRHFGPAPGLDNIARDRGDRINIFVNAYWDKVTGAIPSGYGMTGAVPPLRAGGLASIIANDITVTGSAIGILGLPGIASAQLVITAAGQDGQLVVSGSGSAIFEVFTGLSNLSAALYAIGLSELVIDTNNPILDAKAWMNAEGNFAIVTTAIPRAIGNMIGSALPYTELSPQSLAAAVWDSIAGDFNRAGTMGEKLNGAGSAGNPWTEVIESGLTASEIQRIILSAISGQLEIVGDEYRFKSVDGTVDRIIATVSGTGRDSVVLDGE